MTRHIKLSILLLAISIVLFGCAGVYSPPSATEPTAKIAVKNKRTGLTTWVNMRIDAIDNQSSGLQLATTGTFRVHPGKHRFTVITQYNRGYFSGGPFESIIDVSADLKANQSYLMQSEIKGSQVSVWVTDSSGNRVSSVASAGSHTAPQTIIVHTY